METIDRMFSTLSEEKVWSTLRNNLSPQTSVSSADQEGKAVLQITYNVTDEQVHTDYTSTVASYSIWTFFTLYKFVCNEKDLLRCRCI